MKVLLLIAILLLIPLSASAELIISPNYISETINTSQTYSYNIQLYNNHTFPIYNVSFTGANNVQFPNINVIQPNQNMTVQILAQTTQQELIEVDSTVSYLFSSAFQQDEITRVIQISDISFNPSEITIKKNDRLLFNNTDTIPHNIVTSLFNANVLPSNTFEHQFTEIGTYFVSDYTMYFQPLKVIVVDNTEEELIHNSEYDQNFHISLNSLYGQTELQLTLLYLNFTVNNKEQTEGMFEIKNLGESKAMGIQITSPYDWITFNQNNLEISPNANKYITFTLSPDFNIRNQTGKTYQIPMIVKGTNTNEYSKTIGVTVPLDTSLSELDLGDMDFSDWARQLQDFLNQINALNQTLEQERINNSGTYEFNLTDDFIYQLLREKGNETTSEKINRINDYLNTLAGEMVTQTQFAQLLLNVNQTKADYDKQIKEKEDEQNTLFIIITTIVIIFIILYVYAKKKQMTAQDFLPMALKGKKLKKKDYVR